MLKYKLNTKKAKKVLINELIVFILLAKANL